MKLVNVKIVNVMVEKKMQPMKVLVSSLTTINNRKMSTFFNNAKTTIVSVAKTTLSLV